MPSPLKRWEQPVAITVELVFTGVGEPMTGRDLAHFLCRDLAAHPVQWERRGRDDGRLASVFSLRVAHPLCQGVGCEWHG